MAAEIQIPYHTSGSTLYAIIRNSVGQVWNGSAFESYLTANLANYDIALTEQGTASRYYVGNMPSVSMGVYNVAVYNRSGGAPAEDDEYCGGAAIHWTGTAVAVIQESTSIQVRKNTALANFMFYLEQTTGEAADGILDYVDAHRSLDGAAFAECANAADIVELGNGWYTIDLAASDLNADTVALKFSAATMAKQTNILILTQAA